jgi:hypothetical protein
MPSESIGTVSILQ